jgi:DUF917 family protein
MAAPAMARSTNEKHRMRSISSADLEAMAIGAGILGTGGGGNPYLGKLHPQNLLKQGDAINVIAPEDVDDDALITSVGFMGAPVVSVERIKHGDEPLIAMHALEKHISSPAKSSTSTGGWSVASPALH